MKPYYHFPDDAHEVAFRFARLVAKRMLPEQLAEVNRLNATSGEICHSHDFGDPNQSMIDALREIRIKFDVQNEKQGQLILDAWAIARAAGFDAQRIYDEYRRALPIQKSQDAS